MAKQLFLAGVKLLVNFARLVIAGMDPGFSERGSES